MKFAIFLHPAAHESVESGEDFLIEATSGLLAKFGDDRTLVPVRELDRMVDKAAGAELAKQEDAHVVLLVRRD